MREIRPKIGDVARLAAVSLGTVSAVLNGKGRMSDATRQRVKGTIAQIGYRPDLYASNLARRDTTLFGVVVSNLQNPFFAETAQAVEEEAARFGYQISLMSTNFSLEKQRAAVTQLLGARIAGLAVLTSENDSISRELVRSSGVPAVFLDEGKPEEHLSILRVDCRNGMRAAVEHLIQLGHRGLLYVQNSQEVSGPPFLSHRFRKEGLAAALRACIVPGLRTRVIDIHGPGADAGEQAIVSAFASEHFTAVIAMTDLVAMGVYRGLQSRNLRIPEDVSVVGFDDIYFSRFLNPPLTTVNVPRVMLSRVVVQTLLEGKSGKLLQLPTELVLRSSTATPP